MPSYDRFVGKLLAQYAYGSPSSQSGIKFALEMLPRTSTKILDIGCGIGWSTWEISRHLKEAVVTGLDSSERLIAIARSLFGEGQIRFLAQDATTWSPGAQSIQAAVMLDFYEHLTINRRQSLHAALNRMLDANAMILVRYPSVRLIEQLGLGLREQLQTSDEIVTAVDLELLAKSVNGKVVSSRCCEKSDGYEYIHAIITRGNLLLDSDCTNKIEVLSESPSERIDRVRKKLGLRVGRTGLCFPIRDAQTIAIVSPNEDAYSETFIHAHAEQLPYNVSYLSGSPLRDEAGTFLQDQRLFSKGIRKATTRLLGLPADYFETRSLKRYLLSCGAVAVLAEYGPTGVAVLEACRLAGIPCVVHFHGYDAFTRPVIEQNCGYRQLFERAAAIIAVSVDMKNQLLELGADPSRLFYNPCGVDLANFMDSCPAQAPPTFLAVGRFVEKKAPHLTILAFNEVLKSVPDARLTMIGDGPLRGACQQLVSAFCIDSTVEFLGHRSQMFVADYMRKVRAFVQHSVQAANGDAEGAPVAIMEAQASGLPVVATKHMGIKEEILHGETGFLVDEYDFKSMAKYMVQLAVEPTLASSMGQRARLRAKELFPMDKSITTLANIISQAIDNGDPFLTA